MIVKGIIRKGENGIYLETKHKFIGNLILDEEQVNFLETLVNKKVKIQYETISTTCDSKQGSTEAE